MPAFKDLTGQKFGKLTVIKRAPNIGKNVAWECKCDCGNITIVTSHNLASGHTKSCGCLKTEKYKEDLIGKKFGKLTVVEFVEMKKYPGGASRSVWKCQCDCGNFCNVSRAHLITGHTQSCGCFQQERTSNNNGAKIALGTRFGRLVVLEEGYRKKYNVFWKCQCDCGNITYVTSGHLLSGHTTSCGCLNSKGEEKINIILNKNDILYETEKTFSSLRYIDGGIPRFDFYVKNSYLIEYDGLQHFKPVNIWGGENQLKIQQERDEYKNQWCKENNIPLIRIPYWHYNDLCLKDLLLETTQFRII